MKKMIAITLLVVNLIVSFFLAAYIYYKFEPQIHKRVMSIREARNNTTSYDDLYAVEYDNASLESLFDPSNAWYNKYTVECHGGGAVDGKINTNSMEAWSLSYNRGIRLYDFDINETIDGELVLRHSWDDNFEQFGQVIDSSNSITDWVGYIRNVCEYKQMTLDEFNKERIFGRYTPTTVKDMLIFMQEHDDIIGIAHINTHCNYKDTYEKIINLCKKMNCEDILCRIVVSVDSETQARDIRLLRPSVELTYRFYETPNNFSKAINVCLRNDIHVVMMAKKFITPEVVKMFTTKGIHIYVAMVEYETELDYFLNIGCSGCVSDFLYEQRIEL